MNATQKALFVKRFANVEAEPAQRMRIARATMRRTAETESLSPWWTAIVLAHKHDAASGEPAFGIIDTLNGAIIVSQRLKFAAAQFVARRMTYAYATVAIWAYDGWSWHPETIDGLDAETVGRLVVASLYNDGKIEAKCVDSWHCAKVFPEIEFASKRANRRFKQIGKAILAKL